MNKERDKKGPVEDKAITRGFERLQKWVKPIMNKDDLNEWGSEESVYLTAWSAPDMLCLAYGVQAVGGKPWQPWLAKQLVELQDRQGSWNERRASFDVLAETCYALLMLKQVNVFSDLPVAIKKSLMLNKRLE